MTTEQLTLDDPQPDQPAEESTDHHPSPADMRRAELRDLRNQHAGPRALRTAHTIPTGSYL
ncbi:hypothetical protein ACH49_13595 [Streptomyces leeuwenhoekii]|uniref:Uncharacterized protein n=1 Tax=Streptomyces leeuwenhoekii TaxID=1437453 RepID=A0ABR5HZN7_STRLW|nr:hypothetical protein [Streptomyces leeuwenhoekii]KMS79085.1 hypothetical protein ACH49_13595 [Streptomyces leeuwenhoekii]